MKDRTGQGMVPGVPGPTNCSSRIKGNYYIFQVRAVIWERRAVPPSAALLHRINELYRRQHWTFPFYQGGPFQDSALTQLSASTLRQWWADQPLSESSSLLSFKRCMSSYIQHLAAWYWPNDVHASRAVQSTSNCVHKSPCRLHCSRHIAIKLEIVVT